MSTTHLTEGQARRLAAGAADLVALCGGPATAGAIAGRSAGQMSRYGAAHHPDVMPIDVILLLERHAGRHPVTAILAELAGSRLTPLTDEPEAPHAARVMALTADSSKAVAAYAAALADGEVTPREAATVLAALAEAAQAVAAAKRALAAHLTPKGRV